MKRIVDKEIKEQFIKEFGKKIAKLRKANKMTQEQLAEKCSTDVTTVSRAERGLFDVGVSSLLYLSNAFELSINQLLDIPRLDYYIDKIFYDYTNKEIIPKK